MVAQRVDNEAADAARELSVTVEYLVAHPVMRYASAAAALLASGYSVTRAVRAHRVRQQVAFATFAALTAAQAAGLVWTRLFSGGGLVRTAPSERVVERARETLAG